MKVIAIPNPSARHSREGGNPVTLVDLVIPAKAGISVFGLFRDHATTKTLDPSFCRDDGLAKPRASA